MYLLPYLHTHHKGLASKSEFTSWAECGQAVRRIENDSGEGVSFSLRGPLAVVEREPAMYDSAIFLSPAKAAAWVTTA